MTLIAGNPGTGKSQIAADAAARISTGKNWPNGARAPIGDVVVLATEDAIDDTWVPRLMAAGADLSRLHFLKMAIGDDGKRRTFNLQNDLVALAEKICHCCVPNSLSSTLSRPIWAKQICTGPPKCERYWSRSAASPPDAALRFWL